MHTSPRAFLCFDDAHAHRMQAALAKKADSVGEVWSNLRAAAVSAVSRG